MSKYVISMAASLAALFGIQAASQADTILDQEATAYTTNYVVYEAEGVRPIISQSFEAGYDNVSAVGFYVNDPSEAVGSGSENAVLTIELFASGGSPDGHAPTGLALGTVSKTISAMTNVGNPTFEVFTFASPISVTPDSEFVLMLTYDDPDTTDQFLRLRGNSVGDSYPDGNYLINEGSWMYHDAIASRDLAFQTFSEVSIPEPATMAMVGLAGLMVIKRNKRSQ